MVTKLAALKIEADMPERGRPEAPLTPHPDHAYWEKQGQMMNMARVESNMVPMSDRELDTAEKLLADAARNHEIMMVSMRAIFSRFSAIRNAARNRLSLVSIQK